MVQGKTLAERLGRLSVSLINGVGLGICILPLILIFWLSVISNSVLSLPAEGYTLDWFTEVWRQPQFIDGFYLSTMVAAGATIIGMVVTIPASIVLVRKRFIGRGAIMQLLMSPLIVPAIVIGASLYMTLVELEVRTGVPATGSLTGFVAGHVLLTIPWCVRLLTANLTGLNEVVEEAAASLGASPFAVIWKVTLPLIRPGIMAAAIFSFVVSFGNLEVSMFLSTPGQLTLPVAILQYLQWKIDPTIAAVSVMQVTIIGLALVITNRFVNLSRMV
ncbi:ABC transporter permease [Pseudorhizobium flavum]|uniref:ABC transporter permease n=1 Tax=Pseudorhizobium flavum TaxID=1335061 RepID=UPI002490CFA6|nr:ABC transporter permease [Pseudorhizobium flavum]